MRETGLSKFYWKTKQRRGAKKAIIALSRKMLVIIYHILKNGDTYKEENFELTRQKQELLRIKRLNSEAKKLGFTLTPYKEAI